MRKYLGLITLLVLAAAAFAGRVDYLYAGAGTETPVYFDQGAGSVFIAGKTEVQGKICVGAGTAAAPEIFPGTDNNTGLSFTAADTVNISTGGAARLIATNAGVQVVGTLAYTGLGYPDGAVGAPAYSYAAEPTSGEYRAGAGDVRLAILGVDAIQATAIAITFASPLVAPVGAAATPTYVHTGDPNSGGFHVGADELGWSTNGVQRLSLSTTFLTSTLPIIHPLGAVGAPAAPYAGDANTGEYSSGADAIDFACNGVRQGGFTTTGLNNTAIGQTTPAAGAFTTLTSVTASNVTYKYATASWDALVASTTTRYLAFVPTDNVQIDEIYAWSYATPISAAGTVLLNVYCNAAGPVENLLQETVDFDLEAIGANTGTNMPVQTTDPTHLVIVSGEPIYVAIASTNAIGTNSSGGVTIKYHNR